MATHLSQLLSVDTEIAWSDPEISIRVNPDNFLVIIGPYKLPTRSYLTPLVQLLLEGRMWSRGWSVVCYSISIDLKRLVMFQAGSDR